MNGLKTADVKRVVALIGKYAMVLVLIVLNVVPFLWVIMSSFKDNNTIFARPFSLPEKLMFINFENAWIRTDIGVAFMNSVIASFTSLFMILLLSSMAAYVLSRIRPNLIMSTFFSVGIMIPVHATLIPVFIILKNLHLVNTRMGLILVYIASSLSISIFILSGFLKSIPKEIEESAVIDGCPMYKVYFKIILPIAKAGLATVATLTFRSSWNDYLFASVVCPSPNVTTMTKAIFNLRGQYTTDYGLLYAGLTMAVIPVIVMYVFFQEQVIKGVVAGSIKG